MERVKRRSNLQWEEIVSAQERSGLSARAFCESNLIGEASFYKWRKRLRGDPCRSKQPDAQEAFIEVGQINSPAASNSAMPWQIALELGDGLKLTLHRG